MLSSGDSVDTQRLLDRVREGDSAARDELLALHREYLRQLIEVRMEPELRRRLDPSDVVQETHLEAIERLDDYLQREPMSFRLWLRRNAIEQLANMHRRHLQAQRRSVRREVPLSNVSSIAVARALLGDRPSAGLQMRELADRVRQALAELSDGDRELLLLRHGEELTNAEVAELLGIGPGNASKRYGRALRRLHVRLIGSSYDNSRPSIP